MLDHTASMPKTCTHQILPRSLHDLVLRLRQASARADVLGESGLPVIVTGATFQMGRHGAHLRPHLSLRLNVEGQTREQWTASEAFDHLKLTTAEPLLTQLVLAMAEADAPLAQWQPPPDLDLCTAHSLILTALGSLTVVQVTDDPASHPTVAALCVQEPLNDHEATELPLRAEKDFRRWTAAQPAPLRMGDVRLPPLARIS